MVHVVKRDKNLLEKERAVKKGMADLDAKKQEYLVSLKKNGRFQKFVIEGIIKKNLDRVSNLSNIKVSDNREEMGRLVAEALMTKKVLENILGELLN